MLMLKLLSQASIFYCLIGRLEKVVVSLFI